MKLILTTGKRVTLLLCIFLVCFFVVSVMSVMLEHLTDGGTRVMRIVTILQDVVAFIVPPVVTAMLVTRCPATLLAIDRRPPLLPSLIAIAIVFVSIPLMNWVVWANQNVPFPADVARVLTEMEQRSTEMINTVLGAHTPANLVMSILIVGILAGVSEELLFRGGLQRMLVTGGVNVHVAVWVTAVVFSMMHFQFYGFIPRMLLGAFFGYVLVWTGSLWVSMVLHSLNNILYVAVSYASEGHDSVFETLGAGNNYLLVVLSLLLTTALIACLRKTAVSLPTVE